MIEWCFFSVFNPTFNVDVDTAVCLIKFNIHVMIRIHFLGFSVSISAHAHINKVSCRESFESGGRKNVPFDLKCIFLDIV